MKSLRRIPVRALHDRVSCICCDEEDEYVVEGNVVVTFYGPQNAPMPESYVLIGNHIFHAYKFKQLSALELLAREAE